ncbi:D-galactarate dehydratase [Salmonella enterica subsp. enterica]|uniref:D-galactarate dehydratase n=1 Tax=Salmonella enterica I TaxID=59201 RepID=A0A3S4F2E5_SALET|nr:D-galactarate dehydratase [Salmonella enterica subsp. enterica]
MTTALKPEHVFRMAWKLTEHIPQGHKVALTDIPAHGEIIRYGEVIGYAVRDIPRGSWIDESLVELPKAPPLNTLPLATKVPETAAAAGRLHV